jgi:hypothetical protein
MSGRDDAVNAAVGLGMAASRNLVRNSLRAARTVPGVGLSIDIAAAGEKAVRREVAGWLDEARDPSRGLPELTSGSAVGESALIPPSRARIDLAARLDELMTQSMEQTVDDARHYLFTRMLESLVPDEMRILSALAEGDRYPVIHVATRGRPGNPSERLLDNASTVGRASGVRLPDMVPAYVTHLRTLALVRLEGETPAFADGYEILATDTTVREVTGDAHVRYIRRTLVMSELGRQLWKACREVAE